MTKKEQRNKELKEYRQALAKERQHSQRLIRFVQHLNRKYGI